MISLQNLEKEIDRTYGCMQKNEPGSGAYRGMVHVLRSLVDLHCALRRRMEEGASAEAENEKEFVEEIASSAEPWQEESVKTTEAVEEKDSNEVAEAETETEVYTKESVRGILTDASTRGVSIQPIIAKFVPQGKPLKFSNIPPERYPDVVKELKNVE